MRLINTTTLRLHEFADALSTPPYAILSHRWGEHELSFEQYQSGARRNSAGYHKILVICAMAHQRGLQYAWIDTYCIDKKSSAELSEAINSMFGWYQRAEAWYALLADVKPSACYSSGLSDMPKDFEDSTCFTRGWTLQELIAPAEVVRLRRLDDYWMQALYPSAQLSFWDRACHQQ